jgi:hypothetical protein
MMNQSIVTVSCLICLQQSIAPDCISPCLVIHYFFNHRTSRNTKPNTRTTTATNTNTPDNMPRDEEYDEEDAEEEEEFENEPDTDPEPGRSTDAPVRRRGDPNDSEDAEDRPEQAGSYEAEPDERRKFKYSTADMNSSGRCRKYCCIFLLFMLFFLIMIGLSMLFQWLFFNKGATDNAAQDPERDANSTFPANKGFIDQVCSTGTFDADEGSRCREACEPQFFACCDPFLEFKNIVLVRDNSTSPSAAPSSSTMAPTSGAPTSGPTLFPTSGPTVFSTFAPTIFTFLQKSKAPTSAPTLPLTDAPSPYPSEGEQEAELSRGEEIGTDDVNNNSVYPLSDDDPLLQCSFDQDPRGCMSYAKCQAIGGLIDPAPSTLPILCAAEGLERDRTSCEEACRRARCCWAEPGDNCLARNFDICIDYAPCQNLRVSDVFIVETAPDDLDQACFLELPECYETCAEAECCGDPDSSCFRENFISCLTFAPCTNVTITNIAIPPMYAVVSEPPALLKYACNADNESILEPTDKTCAEYCQESACCREEDQFANCFNFDPLGCVQWEHQCQMVNVLA